ncbi:hypothetical protein ACFSNO_14325, partial [Streptomyces cirratus]
HQAAHGGPGGRLRPPARPAKSGGTVFDGFTYTFVRGTLRLVTDDGSVPPALTKVLDALPPFEG